MSVSVSVNFISSLRNLPGTKKRVGGMDRGEAVIFSAARERCGSVWIPGGVQCGDTASVWVRLSLAGNRCREAFEWALGMASAWEAWEKRFWTNSHLAIECLRVDRTSGILKLLLRTHVLSLAQSL